MAEFVEIDLEKSIDELEKLVAINLFDKTEIRKIAQQRRDNYYSLQKRTKDINDCLRFIKYEQNLLKKIKKRRLDTGITQRVYEIDVKIAQRLQIFFRNTVEHHKADINLWMSYFRFLKKHKFFRVGNKMFQHLFQVHADKEHLWKFASHWSLGKRKMEKADYEAARTWLVKGIEHHPTSKQLYTALVKYDLDLSLLAMKNTKMTEEERQTFLSCAQVSYKNAVSSIPDPKFNADLLDLISQYPDTLNLKKFALEKLDESTENEVTFEARALCALRNEPIPEGLNLDTEQTQDFRMDRCLEIFEQALEHFPTKQMWEKYVNFLKTESEKNGSMTRQKLWRLLYKKALPALVEKNFASPEDYTLLSDYHLESGKDNEAVKILREGLHVYPENPSLWYALVRVHLSLDKTDDALAVLKESTNKLKSVPAGQTLRIWTMVIGFLSEVEKNNDAVEKIYQESMRNRVDLAQCLKPIYLEWRFATFGLEKARELLTQTHVMNPPSLEFYKLVIKIESQQEKIDVPRVRDVFETMLRIFGTKYPEIWIDFINFEKSHGDVKQITKIYQRGLKTLEKNKVDELLALYSLNMD